MLELASKQEHLQRRVTPAELLKGRRAILRPARVVLRLVITRRQWHRIEPLLDANLAEHEQVARLDDWALNRYSAITARVLLLGGQKSPPFITTELFDALQRSIPDSAAETLEDLDHTAPDEKAPELVAERIRRYLDTGGWFGRAGWRIDRV